MPPGPNPLQAAGAKPSHETMGATLFHNRFFTGLWTQRNILRDPSGVVQERWYGGRGDALLDGQNIELTNQLTLARAPGSTAYSTATLPQAADSFYSFKQFTGSTETITVMADTDAVLYSINPTSKTAVLTKAVGAGPSFLIGVNNTLYIGDGIEQQAWSGAGSTRNWGVARYQGVSSVAAYAGAASSVSRGGVPWVNPGNATGAPDGVFATVTVGNSVSSISDYLELTTYNLTVTGTPAGIQVAGTFKTGSGTNQIGNTVSVQLLLNGVPIGAVRTVHIAAGVGPSAFVLGGPTDLWGAGLSATQLSVNNANFGIAIWGSSGTGLPLRITSELFTDAAQVTVFQAGPIGVSLVAGGFSPAPATGFQYVAAYGNSGSPVGQASPPTAVIKPDATHSVQIALVASTDPQVNQIYVFRTRDGGALYENLPTSPYPNTTANVTDSAADTTLNAGQLADLTGLNTPPPFGFTAFEFHMGRIWGAVGNTVYYSVGTDLGLILGSPYEGFPPANFFTFPSAVVRLLSLTSAAGSVLLVFTVSDVYPIYGNISAAGALAGLSGTVFFPGSALLKKVGLASYNALDARGAIVYLMTNDGRVISFNPTSQIVFLDPEKAINEIGFPIGAGPPASQITLTGGTLKSFSSSSAFVTWHGAGSDDQALYVSDGSTGWFRCNPNQQPDGGFVWSTKRNIVGGCSAVQSIETSPGVFQLLIGPPAGGGPVLFRDLTAFSDNGSAYAVCQARIGAIQLAQPGQMANPWFITADFANVGSPPTIGVLFDELDGSFNFLASTDNDPPHLAAPATVQALRYAIRQAASGAQPPSACRWMQIKVDFAQNISANELLSLAIFGTYEQEA